ncbi:ubiquitin carboxyl-terminal hydrolase CYLD [Paramormyrops kingsleyae]|uniref:ubiquitinyl hydrolase 1 n=1 Tax=Paramormyrops kingsleyae TaxID=1676925 RepID=A0A3B3SJC0_9TELE|nr:ubiquitin carboxyl-terminal hydrolase CYLD-like isoform X1 [Paramormyrops kingsleyae]XP_023692193.1 ubiquitin carboxyl-terminal hydrolase CYLD-like isoform X1 [Paramormyrops kingsleyae]
MSGATERSRRHRPLKMYLVHSDYKVEDHLEGAIRLPRGSLCQVQEDGKGDQFWVKVLDSGSLVKIDKQVLIDVPGELSGLLEAVVDAESRFQLFFKPHRLKRLAALSIGAEVRVQVGQLGELDGVLRYRGPLTAGSAAVHFGVQLKSPAAGRGTNNGSYKGHQFFHCPEGCGVFVAASRIFPRSSRTSNADAVLACVREYGPTQSTIQARTTDSIPSISSAPQLQVGHRVCFLMGQNPVSGEVRYIGLLPGKTEPYVGLLLDNPVGSWDGWFKGEFLCAVPSPQYGHLLPLAKVSLSVAPPTAESLKTHCQAPVSPSYPSSNETRTHQSPTRTANPKPSHNASSLLVTKPQGSSSSTVTDQSYHCPRSPTKIVPERNEVQSERGATGMGLEVGCMVEVNDPPLYGVIRWIGEISGIPEPVAGLELDQELTAATDGSYLGERYFRCPANKGLFVKLRNCRRDSRFPAPETPANQVQRCNSIAFADWSSERVEENTPSLYGVLAQERYTGWKKGIQGHLNSCYLDASLFSLFSCSSSADSALLWPLRPQDGPHCCHAQDLLRCEIVNPLRRHGYVCASKTMALRRLLEAESSDTGFTSQEKDPEEFINKLFQLLRVEPLLKIRSASRQPQECHLYQLFPLPNAASPPLSPSTRQSVRVATVQILLETSFMHAGLKFAEAPSCLLLLMPRFGKDYKMFDAILPSLTLDITDLLDDTLRECSICQSVAEWECAQCYEDLDIKPNCLKQYCQICNTQVHNHRKRLSHKPDKVGVPGGPWAGPVHGVRQQMSLFAVTCIQTSHYVSFVRCGPTPTDWLFFDSMADREGGENGFNVPQVKACPEVAQYLTQSDGELSKLETSSLHGAARRLLCDSYMCLYHNPQLSLYK